MNNVFKSYPERHLQNVEGSRLSYARAGIFQRPDGKEEPAVVLFRDRFCLAVLTAEDAYRIADQIIDALENPAIRNTP
ncbi:hypothetical protein [Arthrobacter sp. C9C5]|uniref:hypothetical protein n=1 Tax=Arthrobacter sp. C9C5 TaxID=2735267 RepID=UPI0015858466|nr:hypothetical protein [Arthrobacter sp. C9C5]NUU30840.1 hypothetical protein [Arthrobacter sp. C9C5]